MDRSRRTTAALALLLGLTTALVGCTAATRTQPGDSLTAARLDRSIHRALTVTPYADSIRSILVYVDDRPFLTDYRGTGPGASRNSGSITAAVVSALVGIAIHDGALTGVNQTLGQLLPREARAMPRRVRFVTLERLLTMTGGLAGGLWGTGDPVVEAMSARDPVRRIIGGPRVRQGRFALSGGSAQLIATALQQAVGRPLVDYARAHLFDPLGIRSRPAGEPVAAWRGGRAYRHARFAWPVDRQKVNTGWGLLKLRPADVVRLGLLYLHHGRWHGRRVLPASWVRESTASHERTGQLISGYGYCWWVGRADGVPAWIAAGPGGQLLEVVPRKRLVVAFSSASDPRAPEVATVQQDLLAAVVDAVIAPAFPTG